MYYITSGFIEYDYFIIYAVKNNVRKPFQDFSLN